MLEGMADYPALQAEDNGFLMQLKCEVIETNLETLDLDGCKTLRECIDRLLDNNKDSIDRGSTLPLYVPVFDDGGNLCGYNAKTVWSGAHIDVPLYGDWMPGQVENLIKGTTRRYAMLGEEFLSFNPAFRVALIVHHTIQQVLINPLRAEAFVLGRYKELGLNDPHYEKFGVPTTEYTLLNSTNGLKTEWIATSPETYAAHHRGIAHINGWNIHIRGAHPKRDALLAIWNEIIDRLDEPRELGYTIDGKPMAHLSPDSHGRIRKRVGDPDVERMCDWVDRSLANGTFPMRGSHRNWQEAVIMLGKKYPHLASRWTAESMRKSYQHHTKK